MDALDLQLRIAVALESIAASLNAQPPARQPTDRKPYEIEPDPLIRRFVDHHLRPQGFEGTCAQMHAAFVDWLDAEHIASPLRRVALNSWSRRVQASVPGIDSRRTKRGRVFTVGY